MKGINMKFITRMLVLQEFAIITTLFSGIFLLISYLALTHTTKIIPSEMLTLAVTLTSGASAAALKKGKLSNANAAIQKQTFKDYILIGATTTEPIIVVNYVFLIWLDKSIPIGFSSAIGILAAMVLGFTDFGNSEDPPVNR